MSAKKRSSNTEMVSVPRDLMQDLYEAAQLEADQRRTALGSFRPQVQEALDKIAADAKAILDAPAPQPHPEPIAWMVGTAFWWTKEEAERDAAEVDEPVVGLCPIASPG
ncbi:hypothetical protein [Pseudomonas sp.]|uniref:hypothetical protein n=1 Tax=Pseudomonas sp. TaxID=306 RepID=UPI002896B87F|nr:hypothetical protein [Pseudomonas sp.]